jgi:MFS family permease
LVKASDLHLEAGPVLQKAGANRTIASKSLLGLGCAGKIACMVLIIFGFISVPLWTVSQTIAGPRAIGRWMGLQSTFANLAGIVAPVLTGIAVDLTGNFRAAFAAAALFYVTSAVAWIFGIDKVEPLLWDEASLPKPGATDCAPA